MIAGIFGSSAAIGGFASVVGGAIVGVGISIGVNYAVSALRGNGAAPLSGSGSGSGIGASASASASATALNAPAIKYNERQAIPSKRIIYGTAQVGGALFFEAVKPPYLYQGVLICAKQVSAFRQMWIGAQSISFAAFTPNSILTPVPVAGLPNYPGRLQVCLRLGSPTQAIDPLLHNDFSNLDASFRQQGIATAVIRYHYGVDYPEFTALWGQVSRPNPLFLVDGVAVPDPRNPGHILSWDPSDPNSVAAAEATWSFSNNAALVQAHYLTQHFGGRINPSRMDWGKVASAADWDDGLVGCKDGAFIKRNTIDGVVTLNQSPATVLAGMLSANRGFVLESAGKSWVSSSAPRNPVTTIYDGLLTGAVDYRAAKPKRDMINRVKTQFVASDRQYQTTVGPVFSRPDLQLLDGELLDATLSLPFTLDNRRAQRLAKAFLKTSRLGAQLTCGCDVEILANCSDELVGNTVNFDSRLFPQANGIWFVTSWGFSNSFSSIDISLSQYDPSIETDWTAAADERPFVLAALNVS